MKLAKSWGEVPPTPLTVDGNTLGIIKISSTIDFYSQQIIVLKSNTQERVDLTVKTVIDSTTIELGLRGILNSKIPDLSNFLVSDSAVIWAPLQPRSDITFDDYMRHMYEEEPIVGWRSLLIDSSGNHIDKTNPLQVQLAGDSITIDKLNVKLTAQDNIPTAGDIHDSIRVSDGNNELRVNSDGSLNVNTNSSISSNLNVYNEITAVPTSVLSNILTYIIPTTMGFLLSLVEVSGSNIADYEILIDGTKVARKYTYFGGGMSEIFDFKNYMLSTSQIITVNVTHYRPYVGEFSARILGTLP